MKLMVHERMAAFSLLPNKSTYAGLKEIRVAKEQISFTPEEMKLYGIESKPGENGKPMTTWNTEKAATHVKDIPISNYIAGIIQQALADMEKKGTLTDEYMSLYEKFVISGFPAAR